jgi:hypothetical protein
LSDCIIYMYKRRSLTNWRRPEMAHLSSLSLCRAKKDLGRCSIVIYVLFMDEVLGTYVSFCTCDDLHVSRN